MKGIKRLGAMALAAAMTITLIAPVSAKASFYYDTDNSAEYKKNDKGEITGKTQTGTKYTNKVTGETYTYDYKAYKSTGDYYKATLYDNGIRKSLIVGTNDYNEIKVNLDPGSTITSIKVSKGKNLITLTQSKFESEVVEPDWDSEAKKFYFRKLTGDKEYIALSELHTPAEWEAAKRVKNSYAYRVYGKKKGNAEVKITVKDAAGKVKTTKVKVPVSDENRRITKVTYAGKALTMDYNKGSNNSGYYAKQSSNKAGNFYVTKKSGKFKVTLGQNYKFIAAYVIKPNPYTTKTDTVDNSSSSHKDVTTTTESIRQYAYGIDLNGDGDFEDTINGINESSYKNKSFVKVGNNRKITLNTIPNKTDKTVVRTYGDQGQYTSTERHMSNSNLATTEVIVVYQDKLTKEFLTETYSIKYRASKK